MKRCNLFLLLAFFWLPIHAQTLEGKVIERDARKPVPSATLFLSNTMVSATTREDGSFVFPSIPSGRYELIISCTGYRTRRIEIKSSSLPNNLTIELEPYTNELKEVVVRSYEKDGWEKWGKFFLEQFIGTTPFTDDVDLENPEEIKFIHDKTNKILSAFSRKPLIIKNKALGYELFYELELFEFKFSSGLLLFKGFPLFIEMTPKRPSEMRKWLSNRKEAYQGSMMHFFRALYRNQLLENGFEIRSLIEVTNEEKSRVKKLLANLHKPNPNKVQEDPPITDTIRFSSSGDSMSYYQQIIRLPDKSDYIQPQIIPSDSIAYAIDSVTVGMYFDNFLQVNFPGKKTPMLIADATNGENSFPISASSGYDKMDFNRIRFANKMKMISKIKLLSNEGITVLSNGSFFESTNIISYGYWAIWERISTLLPLDYKQPPPL